MESSQSSPSYTRPIASATLQLTDVRTWATFDNELHSAHEGLAHR
jgi:hypothetical protein